MTLAIKSLGLIEVICDNPYSKMLSVTVFFANI